MYREQNQNKNNDDNWPISVQHSVNKEQNSIRK